MSHDAWLKLGRIKRAWRRTPLTLLGRWREGEDRPLLFRQQRAHYLLCRESEARQLIRTDLSDHLRAAQTIRSQDDINAALGIMTLPEWIPLLQRFIGVSLTSLLEYDHVESLNPQELIGVPLTSALLHHLFGLDAKRTHLEPVIAAFELMFQLDQMLDSPDTRLRETLRVSRWQQRRLRQLYRQIGAQSKHAALMTPERGVPILYHLLELRRQVVDTLTWVFAYLEYHPRLIDPIFNEINAHLKSSAYTPPDLMKLPTLYKLTLETLRVAPPHWVTSWGEAHSVLDPDLYLERFSALPPNTQVLTSPFLDQRDAREWPSPLTFTPDRFVSTVHGAPLPSGFTPLGSGDVGRSRFAVVLHTVIALSIALLRRGRPQVVSSEGDVVRGLESGEGGLFVERQTGSSFGAPELTLQFHMDERYIYIPSARI